MRAKLTAMFQSLTQDTHTFKPGDIAEWKPGLKNKVSKGPFIITETFPPILINEGIEFSGGSPYYRERADCKVAVIDSDNDFMEFYYDSRRLQPVK